MKFLEDYEIQPVPVPRFVSPRKRVSYHSEEVQEIILEAFAGLLPRVNLGKEGRIEYGGTTVEVERIRQSEQAEPGVVNGFIGPRLAAGRQALLEMISERDFPEGVKALLLNFRLPDPESDVIRYRTYMGRDGNLRAFVCWAFENQGHPFLPIEEVVSGFGPIPVESKKESGKITTELISKVALLGATAALLTLGVFIVIDNDPEGEVPIIVTLEDAEPKPQPTTEEELDDQPEEPVKVSMPVVGEEVGPPIEPSLDRILVDESAVAAKGTPGKPLNPGSMVLNQ